MVEHVSYLLLSLFISCLRWDRHIFGTRLEGDSEDKNRPPTMADTIRAKRATQKAAEAEDGQRSFHSPPTIVFINC
jgi:hypothetical protein